MKLTHAVTERPNHSRIAHRRLKNIEVKVQEEAGGASVLTGKVSSQSSRAKESFTIKMIVKTIMYVKYITFDPITDVCSHVTLAQHIWNCLAL